MDSLIEAITELVVKELELAGAAARVEDATLAVTAPPPAPKVPKGARVLVVPGGEKVGDEVWAALEAAPARPSALLAGGLRAEQVAGLSSAWPVDSRSGGWSRVVADYRAVILVGADLPTLGSIAALGAGGQAAAGAAVAALAAGLPVFCEAGAFEAIRRHSSRLAPGLVRALEDSLRTAASFGIEFGSAAQLSSFLGRLSVGAAAPAAAKNGGRDVVTTEDVEAARRSGAGELLVGMGAIVTPLARQQASEWGIEVKFQ